MFGIHNNKQNPFHSPMQSDYQLYFNENRFLTTNWLCVKAKLISSNENNQLEDKETLIFVLDLSFNGTESLFQPDRFFSF